MSSGTEGIRSTELLDLPSDVWAAPLCKLEVAERRWKKDEAKDFRLGVLPPNGVTGFILRGLGPRIFRDLPRDWPAFLIMVGFAKVAV